MAQQQTDQWNMTKADVLRMVDKLGRPLDDEIVDTVVALQMLGIHTTASCSGHIDRVTGCPGRRAPGRWWARPGPPARWRAGGCSPDTRARWVRWRAGGGSAGDR